MSLADDTNIIANSADNLRINIEILRNSARKKGLEISEKSKIIQVRGQKDKEICNFEITKTVKYLEIKLGGRGRNISGEEKKMWLKKAQGHAAK